MSVSLHSWTEDVAELVEVLGRPAWVFPSFSSFLVYYLLKAQLIQNLWNLLKISWLIPWFLEMGLTHISSLVLGG